MGQEQTAASGMYCEPPEIHEAIGISSAGDLA